MDKYNRLVSISGSSYRMSLVMSDIFLAHSSDIKARGETELVPLLHEGGLEILLITPSSAITVSEVTPNITVAA